MKKYVPFIAMLIFLHAHAVCAQGDSLALIALNQHIDDLVVKRDVKLLQDLYADDFVFSHGSGKVEGKDSWLKTVGKAVYPSRQHDSVKVELHPGVAVVKGKMDIRRNDKDKVAVYHLRYIRVYALRGKQWQMISHSTTEEKHDN
ncbi:MAG: nuclear transport factor 2 family protein [Chitinophagaceae bacterium]